MRQKPKFKIGDTLFEVWWNDDLNRYEIAKQKVTGVAYTAGKLAVAMLNYELDNHVYENASNVFKTLRAAKAYRKTLVVAGYTVYLP